MDKLKLLFIQILVFVSVVSYGQNKHFTIGLSDYGICFGNSKTHSGLRFNIRDKNVGQINGLNLAGITKSTKTNGLSVGLLASSDSIINGLLINGIMGETSLINGMVISGLGQFSCNINGVGIGGLSIAGDTLNGLFLSPFGITYWNDELIDIINGLTMGIFIGSNANIMNGVTVSLLNNRSNTLNGVAIGAFNRTKNLYGVQFGLWNVVENNRIFKRMPIMNLNFRRPSNR